MHKVTDLEGVGYLQFFDSEIPGLQAGHYEIEADISLPNADTDFYQQSNKQDFDVQGPQFSIDASEIHSMFPGDNSNGDFSQVLPVISLMTPALPWERAMTASDNSIPWMALLVFSANELNIDPVSHSPVITTTVDALLAEEYGMLKPDIDPSFLTDTILSSQVNTIVISTAVFTAVTPRLNELSMLARCCMIDPSSQPINNDMVNNYYAEVMANRFPQSKNSSDDSGAVNYVQLVSLEGLADYLTDNPEWPVTIETVQLVSLASWSFTSTPQPGQSFAALSTQLISSANNNPDNLLLRIPVTDDGSDAAARINDGYTALSYETITGAASFCWYRGPFIPYPAVPLPTDATGYLQPAGAMIYDEANAIFDNSYSTAWSIGRAMALADPSLTSALQQIRSRAMQLNARIIERSFMPHLLHITDAAALLAPGLSRKAFYNDLQEFQSGLTAAFDAPLQQEAPTFTPVNSLFPHDNIPDDPADKFKWFLRQPAVQSAIADQLTDLFDVSATWLAKLALLEGIPFTHLVPDQRMLPVESVRFFFIDDNWINLLLQGAQRIGVTSSVDQEIFQWVTPLLTEQIKHKAAARRSRLLKKDPGDNDPALPVAGMLLRSALLTSWPALKIEATADIIRMENIASNILLILWKDIPTQVTISQPDQGLSYGVEDEWKLSLRSLNAENLGASLNTAFPSDGDFQQFMRPVQNDIGNLVLQLVPPGDDTTGYLIPALNAALEPEQPLSASTFAIEMIRTPEQIVFNVSLTDK